MIRARLLVFSGTPLIIKGGEIFFPSHVYLTGIASPFSKAGLDSFILPVPVVFVQYILC